MATPRAQTVNTNTIPVEDVQIAFLYIADGVLNVSPVLFLWISISRQIETSYAILPFCIISASTGTIFALALSSIKYPYDAYMSRIFQLMFLITRSALGVVAIAVTLGRRSVLLVVMFSLCQLLHFLHDFIFVRLFCKVSFVAVLVIFALWETFMGDDKKNSNQATVDAAIMQFQLPGFVVCTLFMSVHFDACYVAFAHIPRGKNIGIVYRIALAVLINAVQFASIWYTHYHLKVSFLTSMIFSILTLGAFVEALHDSVQNAIMATHVAFAINANQSYVVLIVVFASIVTLLHPYTIMVLGVICTTSAILMVLLEYLTTYRLYV